MEFSAYSFPGIDYTPESKGQLANPLFTWKTAIGMVAACVTNMGLTGEKLVNVRRDMCQTWDVAVRRRSQRYRQAGWARHQRHHLVATGNRSRSPSRRRDDVLSADRRRIHVGNESRGRGGLRDGCGCRRWLRQTREQLRVGVARLIRRQQSMLQQLPHHTIITITEPSLPRPHYVPRPHYTTWYGKKFQRAWQQWHVL